MRTLFFGLVTLVGVGCVICVIVGFVWTVRIVIDQWGVPMGGVSVLFFPATLSIVPWYLGFVLENWWPLALIWGGSLVGRVSFSIIEDWTI